MRPVPAARAAALALIAPASLSSCYVPVRDPIYTPCRVLSSSDWTARIVRGPHRDLPNRTVRMLQVTGNVTLPAGSDATGLDGGPKLDLLPPVQQVVLRIEASGDSDGSTSTQKVSGTVRMKKGVEGVVIRCGDGIIAEIPAIAPEQ